MERAGSKAFSTDGWFHHTAEMLLMINILHDLVFQNPRNSGSIVYTRSCRISIIKSSTRRCDCEGAVLHDVFASAEVETDIGWQ